MVKNVIVETQLESSSIVSERMSLPIWACIFLSSIQIVSPPVLFALATF